MSSTPASANDAMRAGAWSAADVVLRQGMQFAVMVVLARLLPPEAFGTVALLAVFTALATVIIEGGATTALVRTPGSTRVQESTVFWFNLCAGLVVGALLLIAAPWIAAFYRIPLLVPLIGVAAAQIVFTAAGSIHTALLARALNFRALLLVSIVSTLCSGTVGISLALKGFGVWALALQLLTGAVTTTAMLWLVSAWRPVLVFRFSEARALFRFGTHVVISGFLDVLYGQAFALVIGKLHGVRDLGFYNRAQGAQALPINIISSIIGRVTLPLLAFRSNDPETLRNGVRRAARIAMAVNMPALTGLAVLSDLAMIILFGDAWLPAAPVLSVLAMAGIGFPLALVLGQGILAQDRSREYLSLVIAKQIFGALTALVGSFFGIMGLAFSAVIYGIGGFILNARATKRFFGYGAADQLKDLSGIAVACCAMAGFLLLLRQAIDQPPLIEAAIALPAGFAFYLGFCALFRVSAVMDALPLFAELARPLVARLRPGKR